MSSLPVQHDFLGPAIDGWQQAITGTSLLTTGTMTCAITANGQAELRTTHKGCQADFYRNLNRPGLFSCRQRTGQYKGKVTGYANIFVISNPIFTVSAASRQRTLTQNKRNVHAFTRTSALIDAFEGSLNVNLLPAHKVVTYQPFQRGEFFDRATGESIKDHKGIAILFGANVYCLNQ
jgi:hypothetical protein